MKKIMCYITFFFVFSSLSLMANIKYQSKFLKYLHQQAIHKHIVSKELNELSIDTLFNGNVSIIYPSKSFSKGIITEFTKDTILIQLGINIFNDSLNEGEQYLKTFLERYFFAKIFNIPINKYFANEMQKVLAMIDGKPIKDWTKSNLRNTLSKIKDISFSVKLNNLNIALIDSSGHNLELVVPMNINLLTGMDKKELDDYSVYRLKNFKEQDKKEYANFKDGKLLRFNDSIYYMTNNKLINGLDQTCYFVIKNKTPQLLFEPDKPLLSIKNMLLNPSLRELTIKVSHHLYAQKIIKYNQLYKNIFGCLAENSKVFAGYESSAADSIKFLVVFYQSNLMNIHLLSLSIPRELLYNSRLNLCSGTLYTNIRVDNLDDIFKEYSEKRKLMKIDLSD